MPRSYYNAGVRATANRGARCRGGGSAGDPVRGTHGYYGGLASALSQSRGSAGDPARGLSNQHGGWGGTIGAESPEWGFSQYQAEAKKIASTADAHSVIGLGKDGNGISVQNFDNKDAASKAYGLLAEKPGAMAYIAVFDKTDTQLAENGGLRDEGFFVATSVEHTHTKVVNTNTHESAVGWVLAGIVAIGGIILTGGKKKRV